MLCRRPLSYAGGVHARLAGVCALNIEAMNVMKRGAPPGGANPFPINLPPVEPVGGESVR